MMIALLEQKWFWTSYSVLIRTRVIYDEWSWTKVIIDMFEQFHLIPANWGHVGYIKDMWLTPNSNVTLNMKWTFFIAHFHPQNLEKWAFKK